MNGTPTAGTHTSEFELFMPRLDIDMPEEHTQQDLVQSGPHRDRDSSDTQSTVYRPQNQLEGRGSPRANTNQEALIALKAAQMLNMRRFEESIANLVVGPALKAAQLSNLRRFEESIAYLVVTPAMKGTQKDLDRFEDFVTYLELQGRFLHYTGQQYGLYYAYPGNNAQQQYGSVETRADILRRYLNPNFILRKLERSDPGKNVMPIFTRDDRIPLTSRQDQEEERRRCHDHDKQIISSHAIPRHQLLLDDEYRLELLKERDPRHYRREWRSYDVYLRLQSKKREATLREVTLAKSVRKWLQGIP